MVTNFVLLLLAARPNLCISAPCMHNLIPSPSDIRTLSAQMFVWSLIEPDQGTDPAEKEPRKKKKSLFFLLDQFPVWVHCLVIKIGVQEELWG